jgi:hypothetical protein
VCPHCRQWLKFLTLGNPRLSACILVLAFLPVFYFFVSSVSRAFNPRPWYYESSRGLHLIETNMSWRQLQDGELRIVLTGVISNESEVPWEDVEFECRFFNTNGAMIDVANFPKSLTVQPHDDTAFSAAVWPSRSTNIYASYQLSVVSARNANSHF